MENKVMQDIFEQLKELNLPFGKFAIFGSGPLVIRGLKEFNDLDLLVSADIFSQYLNDAGWKLKGSREDGVLQKGRIDMAKTWKPGEWDAGKLIKEAEMVNGWPCVRLEEVLRWKGIRKAEKDIKDIEILKKCLGKNN